MIPSRDLDTDEPVVALARSALQIGRDALASGDLPTAFQWLDRAHRLVPADPNAALVLATAYLTVDPARAAGLLDALAEQHDVCQVWIGLAAARLRLTGPVDAAVPLARALSQYAITPEAAALAEAVAAAAGFPGWCGLTGHGTLRLSSTAAVAVAIDGQALSGTTLPARWHAGRRIDVLGADGRTFLGSPICIDAITALSACVETRDGEIVGWAWHPRDPVTDPELELRDADGVQLRSWLADDETMMVADTGAMARPRSVRVPTAWLRGPGPFHICGADGRDLPGSPLEPGAAQLVQTSAAQHLARIYAARHPSPTAREQSADETMPGAIHADGVQLSIPVGMDRRRRNAAIVIPVHNGGDVVRDCFDTVLATTPGSVDILVVDDGSDDAATISLLDALDRTRRIKLLRQAKALGFPASSNNGMRAARGRDIVLLNSDTLMPPGWFERLREAAYGDDNIGTVTPLTNDGTIVSYPGPAGTNRPPDRASVGRYDRFAAQANRTGIIDIPVGVGFCMYIRRDCLNATGVFRADVFAQGYGEEVDFCLRARALGWRHVAHTGVFVGHVGGGSFGSAGRHLRARNSRIIERLHPGYDALIERFGNNDPLAPARRAIDALRFRQRGKVLKSSIILVTHDDGGGVEQRIAMAAQSYASRGIRPIILRPGKAPHEGDLIYVQDGCDPDDPQQYTPNLAFAMPAELNALVRLLRGTRPTLLEVHHLLGYSSIIYQLLHRMAVPYRVHIHDYGWFCPRLALVGGDRRYCGEPELDACEACVADHGHFLNEKISVAALRTRSASFLTEAAGVVAPSEDTANRMRRHFPGLQTQIAPHSNDAASIAAGRVMRRSTPRPLVCVVGAIGEHKGYDILLACGRDAKKRDLDLNFVVVGFSIDDARLLATERIFVTGRFVSGEAVDLISEYKPNLGFVPSVAPETWCLALDDLWRSGLDVACFDIGAPAERIRRAKRGFVLPLGLPPNAINNALVAAVRTSRH